MKLPPSFFVPGPLVEGSVVRLPEDERRHARARRLRRGSPVRLVDGAGSSAEAAVETLGSSGLEVRIGKLWSGGRAADRVTVLAPVLRAARLAWLVEKATELGAGRILLVRSSRSQGDRAAGAANDTGRLRRIAREASKQCGRSSFPSIEGPVDLDDAIRIEAASRLLLDPGGAEFPRSLPDGSVAIWIGPEGGFDPDELRRAEGEGWRRVGLPGFVLRAETAVVAGLALAGRAIDTASGRTDNNSIP